MKNHLDETVSALDDGSVPAWISAHVKAYKRSDGAEGHLWDSTAVGGSGLVPCLLLSTVGRKSGKPYIHPLLYGQDGERFVVVGSKGGSETQPQWYFNLLADSVVTVQVKADKFRGRATLVAGLERDRLWKLMTAVYPAYLDYQAKTCRELPVFCIERIAE